MWLNLLVDDHQSNNITKLKKKKKKKTINVKGESRKG